MKLMFPLFVCASVCLGQRIYEPNVYVETFAGSGFSGDVNGIGEETMFSSPTLLAPSPFGLLVWDSFTRKMRVIDDSRSVTHAAIQAPCCGQLEPIRSMVGIDGTVWIRGAFDLVTLPASGVLSNFSAGRFNGGYNNGALTNASFSYPSHIAIAADGTIYVSDTDNHRIRKIDPNTMMVSTIAGSGNAGGQDGNGIFTSFYYPASVAVDSVGNIYVADQSRSIIRRISTTGQVARFVGGGPNTDGQGTNAGFGDIRNIAIDGADNIIVIQQTSIRRVTPSGTVTTIAGHPHETGYANGAGAGARFKWLDGVALNADGKIYVADRDDHRIRRVTLGTNTNPPPVSLGIMLVPSVTVTGAVGSSYRIEYSTKVNTNWTQADVVTLLQSQQRWTDTAPDSQQRFYRAVLVP